MGRGSGYSHIDLATKDMEATRSFYEGTLGFPLVRADLIEIVGHGERKPYLSEAEPEAVEKPLEAHDVTVRGPVDHEGWCKSIYFDDPDGLQLEYCHLTRELDADDAVPRVRFRGDGRRKLLADTPGTSA